MFSPGTYYIGDPCYVIEDWDRFLDEMKLLEENVVEVQNHFDGKQVFVASTAYGDGTYFDNERHEYGVDAGLLSIIPIELCTKDKYDITTLGRVVEFKKPFRVYCEDRGVFRFGHLSINTKDDPEEEDEYGRYDDEDGYYERR